MVLRDYRNIARLSYVLIVVAIVLFAFSIDLIYSDSPAQWSTDSGNPVLLAPNGGNATLHYNVSFQQGDDIYYRASSNNSLANVTMKLIEPSGTQILLGNITGTSPLSNQLVVSQYGNYSFLLINNANSSTYVNLSADRISFYAVYTLVFGMATMASGLVLLILSYRIKRGERRLSRRQRRLD